MNLPTRKVVVQSTRSTPGKKKLEITLSLPTEKSSPSKDMSSYKYYFFGPRKIGKTSFASSFPDCLNLFTEPSGSDYQIFQRSVFCWNDIMQYVELIEREGEAGTLRFKNVSFDIVDKAYKYCIENVCLIRGCTEDDLGWGWDEVKKTFEEMINRLARWVGVIFVSHVKERKIDRADGTKYDVLMPSSMKNAYELISSICDLTGYFYTNRQNKRVLRILPSNETETGNRFENHFNYKNGGKIAEIEMGLTKHDAYKAFEAAFNNELEEIVEEVNDEVEDVEETTGSVPTRKIKGK